MKLVDFLDARDLELVVRRYPNQKERWSASIESCDVAEKERAILRGVHGNGPTSTLATQDYIEQIAGKEMKHGPSKQYFRVPDELTFG